MKKRRIHLDATKACDAVRVSLCGYLACETTADVVQVTCKACLTRLKAGNGRPSESRGDMRRSVSASALASSVHGAIMAALGASAGPPPVMTPQIWACVKDVRCGSCEQCEWERSARLWEHVEPWKKKHRAEHPADRPRWASVDAALVAFAEWERHGRHESSACGAMLDRIRRGQSGGRVRVKRDNAMHMKADDVVHVRIALEAAYPEGGHARLGASICRSLLLARTAGVLEKRIEYGELSELVSEAVGEVQSIVREGRRRVANALIEKGMVRS